LLSDLSVDGVVLGKYTHLIVDEAHALEGAARTAFTRQLTERAVLRMADDLSSAGRRRRGWLQRTPFADGRTTVARVEDALGRLRKQVTAAFRQAEEHISSEQRRAPFSSLDDLSMEFGEVSLVLKQVEDALDALSDHIDDIEALKELEGHIRHVQSLRSVVEVMEKPAPVNTVHWYEQESRAVAFHATPLDVAPLLTERLYPKLKALVLTSATLSLGGEFDYLCQSVGLTEDVLPIRSLIAETPFDYAERMRILVPQHLPPVQGAAGTYATAVAHLIATLCGQVHRNGLALFTSYEMMHAVQESLPSEVRTLVQGELSRTALIDRFRVANAPTWLLGTESFWEGVDFPREELEILLVARLPFPVPTDPVLAALGERMARIGRDPFKGLSLPMAGLKLRQGIGRLIRTSGDRGLVIISDQRIVTRAYGRIFAASLPVNLESVQDEASLLREARAWFDA
jgi:ATP-dependent DNA helicase DinG